MFWPTRPQPSSFINITMGGTHTLHSQKSTQTDISDLLNDKAREMCVESSIQSYCKLPQHSSLS
jgi:hypothetical protein